MSSPDPSPEAPLQGAESAIFESAIPPEEVEAQLKKILQSSVFCNAPRHSRFLEFTAKKTLVGEGNEIKEYLVGLEVFDQQDDFDPRSDPIVRAEARRLRSRLADYYRTIGEFDAIQIELPKGTYVPVFSRRDGHLSSPTPEASNGIADRHPLQGNLAQAPVVTVSPPVVHAKRRKRWRWLASGIVLGLIVSLLAGYTHYRHRIAAKRMSDANSASVTRARRSVAVLGFANLSGKPDEAWLSTALSEMMTTELGAGGRLLTVPDETVARAEKELQLGTADGLSTDTLARIHKNLNTNLVVSGAYAVMPPASGLRRESNQVRLDIRIQNAVTGETVDSVSETGAEADLFQMIARSGARVRSALGVAELPPTEIERAKSSVSPDPQALRLYAQGVEKLRNFDALGARDLLEQAVKADPQYAMAHSALAEAWLTLGYDNRAAEEAKRGYDLSGTLSREQKLLIDGRYHEASHQWDDAINTYRALFDFYPDNVEYGLRLARAQWEAAKYRDSSRTAQALTKLTPPISNDPRIALAVAKAEFSLGNLSTAEKSVASAVEQAKQNGALLIVAEANLLQVGNSSPSHGLAIDQAHADEAYLICESLGDLNCAAWALYRKAFVDSNNAASRPLYEQALELFTRTGDLRGAANAQIGLGRLSWVQGRDNAARRFFVEAQVTCEKIDDQSCLWKAILHEGNVFAEAGNMPAAAERFQQAVTIAQKTGASGGAAWAMANLGEVRQLQGGLSEALTLFQNSAELNRQHFGKAGPLGMAYAGSALLDQGQIDDARHILEESLAIAHTYMGEERDIGNATMTLARVDLAQQRPAEAEAKLRTIVAYRESIDDKQTAGAYNDFLSLALLAQGKVTEAQAVAAHARNLFGAKRDGQGPLHLTITEARAAMAAKPKDLPTLGKALANLHDVIAQARKGGMLSLEFEARLAEGEIEMQAGAVAAGRAHLASLEREAKANGFGLIAREASSVGALAN